MTPHAARRWRETWARAWPAKDVDAIVALYADDAVYRSHPCREPEASPLAYVQRVFAEEEEVECRFGEPMLAGDRAAVEWWATFQEAGAPFTLAGTTVLRFGSSGLVTEHIDYWVQEEGRREPPPGWGR